MRPIAVAAALLALVPLRTRGEDVVAIVASDAGPYRKALSAFEDAYGKVAVVRLDKGGSPPAEAATVVAFGGQAVESAPRGAALVLALAPGSDAGRPSVQVRMVPPATELLSAMRELQPSLNRLGALWISDSFDAYVEELRRQGKAAGLQIVPGKLDSADDLPSMLRELAGKVDALWLAPDPLLVDARSFAVLKSFSWDNAMPFYAPTSGLAESGATASLAPSFGGIGRAAAEAVRELQAGRRPQQVFPRLDEIVVNAAAAKQCRLDIPDSIRSKGRVVP